MRSPFFTPWSYFWCISLVYGMEIMNTRSEILDFSEPMNLIPIENKWIVQKLDHFNFVDKRTWKQRYFVNEEYYYEGGPVFLLLQGESQMTDSWITKGDWIEYAQEVGALCFHLEHRYYGHSRPTEDLRVKNLLYLNSQQALADAAAFIGEMKTTYEIPSTAKWVAFGGSYAGSLAAWLRLKYSHLVHAAVCTSCPLMARLDFYEYYEWLSYSLEEYDPECVKQIKKANQEMSDLIKTKNGSEFISHAFQLCEFLDGSNEKDVSNLFTNLAGNFLNVQNSGGIISPPNIEQNSVKAYCDIMINESIPDSVSRYAAVNFVALLTSDSECLNHEYTNDIDFFSNTSWDSEAAIKGSRQWLYQACTEFGFFQTSNQKDPKFGNKFPVDFFIGLCADIFKLPYGLDGFKNVINRTNMMYGGLDIRATRVVYVHGSTDPWQVFGITQTSVKDTAAIYINGTSHCANMYPSKETDPPQLTEARKEIKSYLFRWLLENDSVDSDY